jgi:hypothetical protein
VGYSILDLYKFVSKGDVAQTKVCLEYFKQKGKLNRILHSNENHLSRVVPQGAWNGIPIFSAFDNQYKPRYLTAALLLDAGTDPYFYDWHGGNIFHFAMNRSDLSLFKLLLWYADYEKVLQLMGLPRTTTVATRLGEWELVQPGIKATVKATVNDVEKVRALLGQARSLVPENAMSLYIQIAEIYIKHANLESNLELISHYLQNAQKTYQELDERYHQLESPSLVQKQQHVQISKKISEIAKLLNLKEQELTYKAYADMLEIDIKNEQQLIQAAFLKNSTSSNRFSTYANCP